MASTLKRTLTDIMEDELYSPSVVNNLTSTTASGSIDPSTISHPSSIGSIPLPASHESLPFMSLSNNSNDSLQKIIEMEQEIQQQNQNHFYETTEPSGNLDNIYNSYGNPNLFANSTLSDDLLSYDYTHSNRANSQNSGNSYDNISETSRNQQQQEQQEGAQQTKQTNTQQNKVIVNPQETHKNYDSINDDILMVPQDNYMVYDDQQDPQFIPELLQFELAGKNFPQSNELNIFKANDVLYDEFSDDEEDDDDMEFQNKLDDMEMDLDDLSSESSFDDENEEDEENYFFKDVDSNENENSIYSLTVPNHLSSSPIIHANYASSTFGPSFENAITNDIPVFDDDDDEDDFEMSNITDSDELYTPASDQRKESVVINSKPIISDTPITSPSSSPSSSPSDFPTQQIEANKPRRRRSSSNQINNSLRKPKSIVVKATSTFDSKSEEHVCTIANPKTGRSCNKKFSRPYDLVRHQNTIHASKRSFYRCMFCEDDLRRKNNMGPNNEIVNNCSYRSTNYSIENSNANVANSHNSKKLKSSSLNNNGYLSNKTFSRCDALTRHLRFRHGLNNNQVNDAMDYAKKNVEYYDN